jgi:hypothetical protein
MSVAGTLGCWRAQPFGNAAALCRPTNRVRASWGNLADARSFSIESLNFVRLPVALVSTTDLIP